MPSAPTVMPAEGEATGETAATLELLSDPVRFVLMSALRQSSSGGMTCHDLEHLTGVTVEIIGEELEVLCAAGLVESQTRQATDFYQTCPGKLRALASTATDAPMQVPVSHEGEPAGPHDSRGRGRPRGMNHTKARIVLAAKHLVLKVGFDALSLAAVAENAGITRPTISYHFQSKTRLYKSVLAQVHNDIDRAAAATCLSVHRQRPSTQLSEFLTRILNPDGVWSTAAVLPSMVVDCRRHPEVVDGGAAILERVRAFLASSMTAENSGGSHDSDTELATVVEAKVALVLGLSVYAGFVGTNVQAQQVFDYLLTVMDRMTAVERSEGEGSQTSN